jgi:hypothetical protein
MDKVTMKKLKKPTVILSVGIALLSCSNHDRSNPVDPQGTNWNPPTVSVMQDTSVAIKDSFYVHAQGSSKTKAISEYIWEIPEDSTKRTFVRDTTTDNKIKIAFSSHGKYWVKVWAMDAAGVLSGWEKIGGSGDTALQYINGAGYIGITVIGPPQIPALSAPINGAAGFGIKDTLKWAMVNGASTYHLQVLATNKAVVFEDSTLTSAMEVIGGLD